MKAAVEALPLAVELHVCNKLGLAARWTFASPLPGLDRVEGGVLAGSELL
jgi:hypothetical protein